MNSAEGIDIQAEDPRATEQEGRERITAGRLREAIRIFHRLTRQFPERLDLHAQLGYLALLANDLETSIAHLARAINLGLKTRDSLAHLAEAYYRKGRLGSSAYCYQRLGRDGLAGTLAVLSKLETYRLTDGCLPAEIPWVAHHPLPVVGARINGRDANLVLATGAGDTVLDTQFAIDAEARLGGQERRAFAGGLPALVTYGHAERLSLYHIGFQDIPVQVIDLRSTFGAWFPDLPIHGILGTGLLSRFRAALDQGNRHLCLGAPGASQREDGQPRVPLWLAENQLRLTRADLPALDRAIWFLDSGMTGGAFAVPESRVAALGLERDQGATLVGAGGRGTVQGHKVRADWLRLDQVRRDSLDGVVLDSFLLEQCCGFNVQGLLGHDLLRDAVLILDFPAMRLLLTAGGPA